MTGLSRSVVTHGNYALLAELVDYVSDTILPRLGTGTGEPWFSAQAGRLILRHNRVEAEVGPFRLASAARRLHEAANPQAVHGWYRSLRVRTASGRAVHPDTLIRLQASDEAAVAMDRLCRMVHMLNHLATAREGEHLWVHVSLRHVLAVPSGHGAFFEDLLRDCGLGPERLVHITSLPLDDRANLPRVVRACAAYTARGFSIAVDIKQAPDGALAGALKQLAPRWLRVRGGELESVRAVLPYRPMLVREHGAAILHHGDLVETSRRAGPLFTS